MGHWIYCGDNKVYHTSKENKCIGLRCTSGINKSMLKLNTSMKICNLIVSWFQSYYHSMNAYMKSCLKIESVSIRTSKIFAFFDYFLFCMFHFLSSIFHFVSSFYTSKNFYLYFHFFLILIKRKYSQLDDLKVIRKY